MITIKNISAEDLELVTHYDTSVPGFRVVETNMPPMQINPGGSVTMMGYEPGISYTIRPVRDPEIPRTTGLVPGAFPQARG